MNLDNLTIICPTYNRPHMLGRVLKYYANNSFSCKIIVADSSESGAKEILLEFIELLESNTVVEIKNDELIKSILRKDVLKYYTLVTSTIIKNWQVVCEDYLRFYINQYRILACHNILMK